MATRPVRVSAYGLIDFTKAGYLKVQAVMLVVTVLLIVAALVWQPTGVWPSNFFFGNLEWVFPIILLAELGETAVMLRKFREADAARRARPPSARGSGF